MNTDDEERQDEIQAMSAIFAEQWITDYGNCDCYSITLTSPIGSRNLKIQFKLPPGYPTIEKPIFNISAPWMTRTDKAQLIEDLNDLCDENKGCSIIYQLVNKTQIALDAIVERDCTTVEDSNRHTEEVSLDNEAQCDIQIFHGNTLVDRKSIFQAHLAVVHSSKEAENVLEKLKENRKINAATHNMWAYRILKPNSNVINQNCDDDGETHAGSRMLHLLQIVDAKNVIVIVSRWYGGIQLGPDRFKHINNVTRELLKQHNFINKFTKNV